MHWEKISFVSKYLLLFFLNYVFFSNYINTFYDCSLFLNYINGFIWISMDSSSHVWIWELDHKESWVPKNWCLWTVVMEKTLEGPLDCKQFQPVHPKGNQSWIFIERTDAEAETPILWTADAKSWLIGKDPDAGKDWRWEKGTTEDDIGYLHRLRQTFS